MGNAIKYLSFVHHTYKRSSIYISIFDIICKIIEDRQYFWKVIHVHIPIKNKYAEAKSMKNEQSFKMISLV